VLGGVQKIASLSFALRTGDGLGVDEVGPFSKRPSLDLLHLNSNELI